MKDVDLPFCRFCGATIPPVPGEGTCPKCDPKGTEHHRKELMICQECGGFANKCVSLGHIKGVS